MLWAVAEGQDGLESDTCKSATPGAAFSHGGVIFSLMVAKEEAPKRCQGPAQMCPTWMMALASSPLPLAHPFVGA